MKKEHQKLRQLLIENPALIHKVASEDLGHFMLLYMQSLFKYKLGIFQLLMAHDIARDSVRDIVYPTFPDSYAEEILMYSYLLWGILGVNKFTNCVVVCGTREKAKEVYMKFKDELLNNKELKRFKHRVTEQTCDGWNIFVPSFNARISITTFPMIPSRMRHKRRSPDAVICCDLDDSGASAGTITRWMEQELYDKIHFYQKTAVFGSVLRKDNLFEDMRMRGDGENDRRKKFNVLVNPCPLFDENKECFWEERYSQKEIKEMMKNWNDESWQCRYLLHSYRTFRVPKDCLNADGTCDVESYKKYLKSDEKLFFLEIMHEVSLKREAERYSIFNGTIEYRGTGEVVLYAPISEEHPEERYVV